MRKLAALLAIVLAVSMITPTVATARTRTRSLRVHAIARVAKKSGVTKQVVIKSKASRKSQTIVTIYKGKKAIRTIRARGTRTSKTVRWNLKDNKGRAVTTGTYRYTVKAVRYSRAATVQGAVRVSKPRRIKPVPTTDPAPTTPPTATATPGPAPVVDPVPTPVPVVAPTPAPTTPAPTTPARWFGYYVSGAPADMSKLAATESATGAKAHVVNFFVADSESFPLTRVTDITAAGSIPMVTLEFWSLGNGGGGLAALNKGSRDAYLHTFAKAAKAFGGEIWLRPFHEMNGNWYPWCGTVNGNTPEQAVAAWKHTKDIFAQEGATNVKFVWCPNNDSVPNTSANTITAYWPGDEYVDFLSIDGYNWGTSQDWSNWRSFTSLFADAYSKVAPLSSDPMFISETACAEVGGSKAAWITDMFTVIPTAFPRISGVVWFDTNKETDWRISSSESSLAAYKAAVATGY